jgi:hypothetical protein
MSSARRCALLPLLFLGSGLISACSSLLPADDPAPTVRGPLTTRNQQPMALTLMAFRPRRAMTQPEGELGLAVQAAWASTEEIADYPPGNPVESVVVDGETLTTTLRARYGLSERVDIEVELPFLYAWSGALDGFIEGYHSTLHLPDGNRPEFPDDQYRVEVASEGELLYQLEGNRVGVQDLPIFLTLAARREDRDGPGVALRCGVELPIGSANRGFGNGNLDFGLGFLLEKTFGRWTWTGGADLVFPGQSERMAASETHRYENMYAWELGSEYRWNDSFSVLVGMIWTSRMINTIDLEEIAREVFDVGVGGAWDLGADNRLAVSIHEDLVAATGMDLTLQVGWSWGY